MAANNTTTKTATARKSSRPTSPQPPSDDVIEGQEVIEVDVVATVTEPVTVKAKGGRKPNPLTQVSARFGKARAELEKVNAKIAAQMDLGAQQAAAQTAYDEAKEALDAAYAALTA